MNKVCDVSIVLVNYNGKRYIDTLMDSLCQLKHSDFSYEVVFIDNASTDDSLTYLTSKHYEESIALKIICSEINLGFAAGNNLGVRNASGKYIVFLNNDTRPDPSWLEELYHFINARPDVVMANSKLLFFYDFLCLRFHTQDKIYLGKNLLINNNEYLIDGKFCKNVLYEHERIVCFGHSEILIPLLDGATAAYTLEVQTIFAGEQDTVELARRTETLVSGAPSRLSISDGEIMDWSLSLVQNAGSGINKNYDGYDIGFCQRDCKDYNQAYEITNGCGAAIILRKADFEACGGFDEDYFMYYEDTDLSFRMRKNGGKIMYCPNAVVRHIHAGSSTEWSPFFTYYVCRNKLLFLKKNVGRRIFLRYFLRQLKDGLHERNRCKIRACVHALIGRTGWQPTD